MKSTIKLFLVVALFVSTAFADGDMGSGGAMDGDMGSGGKTCTTTNCLTDTQPSEPNGELIDQNSNSQDSDKTILNIVQDYLNTIFG